MLSALCAFGALVVIPGLFGGNRLLASLAGVFVPLAWLMSFAFAAIAVLRFIRRRPAASVSAAPARQGAGVSHPPLTELDRALAERELAGSDAKAVPAPVPRPAVWSLQVIDRMEWKRFEDLCCAFYREKGIRAQTTRLGADGGVDIRLFLDDAVRPTAIVQCKAWKQAVGVKPVRELRGVMAHEKVEKAFFMAPNGFTEDARLFARDNRITLLDGKLILAMLERLPEPSRQRLLDFATAGDWTVPTCPGCGAKLVARQGSSGPFWGCASYPRCRGKLNMRAAAH